MNDEDNKPFNPTETFNIDTHLQRMRRNLVTIEESGRKGLEANRANPESTQDKNRNPSWRFIKFVILPLLVLAIAFGVYKIFEGEKLSKDQQAAERETLSNLAKKYNAVTDWKSSLEQLDDAYVADVQEALIRKDGRPLLISVEVTDVEKQEDKTYVHFNELDSDDPDIRFILECNPEQIKVINENRDESSEFTVIASIASVRRANKDDVQDESDITGIFVASGHCLELLPSN